MGNPGAADMRSDTNAPFIVINPRLVTNAINILQACIYKSVKFGLFLKSIKTPCVVKFTVLMPVSLLNTKFFGRKT